MKRKNKKNKKNINHIYKVSFKQYLNERKFLHYVIILIINQKNNFVKFFLKK